MQENDSNEFNETKPASLCFITLRSLLFSIQIFNTKDFGNNHYVQFILLPAIFLIETTIRH